MATSLTVGPPPEPASDLGSQFNLYTRVVTSLAVAIACAIVAAPAAVVGMAVAWLAVRLTRPARLTGIVLTAGSAVSFLVLAHEVEWLWPWGALIPGRLYGLLPPSSAVQPLETAVWRSCAIELLLGPILFLAFDALLGFREHTIGAGIYHQVPRTSRRGQQYDSPMPGGSVAGAANTQGSPTVLIGTKTGDPRRPFTVSLDELAHHVFIPGASGSGKTTTLARIADGAMHAGYGLVIVDCKGGGLGATAKSLAARHGLPFVAVDPTDPSSVGYNPATGDPPSVANKLLGAFSFGAEGEIYKQVAMRVVPVIVRGLMAAHRPVTLASVAQVCEQGEMARLAHQIGAAGEGIGEAGELQDELLRLSTAEGVGKAGIASLEYRFGSLLQGTFGPLIRKSPALDWDAVLAAPAVIYLALPVTAASEDVELMGRVVAQDLKQFCARRLRAVQEGGRNIVPVIVAFDEFAALREADQITDLLLQARQAQMPIILSTQYLPQEVPIRQAALTAGLLIAHRLEAVDAQDIAAQFGTRRRWRTTYQYSWDTGETEKGSVRDVEEFIVHPNVLRRLQTGQTAIRSVNTSRAELVTVSPVT